MKESLRKSGIDVIGDVPWGTHFCQFYQTKEDLMEIIVPYFKAGLENNELCVWITSKPLEAGEAKEALRRVIPDFDVYLEKGQIEIIPYIHEHINEGVFGSEKVIKDRVKKSDPVLAGGYGGLRTAGDTPWSKKGELGDFVDYESEVDANIGKYQTISLFPYFLDMCSTADILKIAFNHQFALIKKEGIWERIESYSRKRAEEELRRSEQHFRLKLENMLSLTFPSRQMAEPELADIVDARAIHSLMDDFYNFAHITMALVDLKGNVLVNVGWQDICTRFHRVHPETCKRCVESDTKLSAGVAPGEFKLYKCKNNMWDVATPIIVDGRHVGNIFSGQFFFEEETPDYEFFRIQARKYDFNEKEYIAALEKVPRLSRETVGICMSFFMKLAHMISQLGYSNIKMARSLTERDALLDVVRESEERFRSVLEHSLDAAYRRNLQTDSYDYMSPVIKQITGFSVREMSAMSINEVLGRIHPDDLPLVSAELARALDAGRGTVEYRFRCRDGKYRWLADHFTEIKDQNSRPLFRGGIVRDITEHKQVEEALIRNENKFRTLAENSPDIIVRFDRQKRHIYANPAAVEPYSRSPEEIIGKTHTELGMNPEKVKFLEEHHENVFSTGKPETAEFQHTSPRGKEYYFNTRIVPEFAGGEVTSVLAISRDITYAKEAESRLKEAHENLEKLVEERTIQLEKAYNLLKESEKGLAEAQKMAHIGNWEWDIASDKAYWSEEMYRIFRRDPREMAPSYDEYLSYIHPDDRDYYDNAHKGAVEGKPYSTDQRIILASGEEHTIHLQSEVIFNEEKVPVRLKGTVQDITERKKAEKALVNLESARKKEIHHRIKNNLQVISSLLDLQAEKFNNREHVEKSEIMEAFRESQDRVISMALIHEELYKGGGFDTLNFSSYIEELAENLFQTYRLGNADINLKMDLEEKIFFDMDIAVPLGIIVNELVSNSLKHAFTEEKEGEIRIRLCREENNNKLDKSLFSLTISDNGNGIPENVEFESFESLGLQLVSILVDQLDGKIDSKQEQGTKFIITFKVAERS
ncbi:sensory transduction histidine kinase [Methanosarcina siciliae T4/M]|uniref:Sensory transduction histidine kinase n=2 Tax=Methanosarcina siciliae TaxID=38027 RepID=A0A0E3PCE1_9EURY|nr:PocR ligand-binding domain-containing protein [Methanosarcina siciliae]AKB27193.1 sensory transduction histidine kinase [Methanosarcina siciliae T4/M]AKB31140.1 sensory transduction histidine kinase [Methanosarcina siciliae HI350]